MMNSLCDLLQFFATVTLGLFVGALLAEGALLVPHWRTLPAEQVFSLNKEYMWHWARVILGVAAFAASLPGFKAD